MAPLEGFGPVERIGRIRRELEPEAVRVDLKVVHLLEPAGQAPPVYHITQVIEVRQTPVFARWLDGFHDRATIARINVRIRRLSLGNPGDVRAVGQAVSELRIDYGPGYRIYYRHRDPETVVLLCGGDKRTQDRDIDRAKQLAKEDGR